MIITIKFIYLIILEIIKYLGDFFGGLQAGDRIIQVDGVNLGNCSNERAVELIQKAGDPVRLLVQSLVIIIFICS